MRHAPNEKFIDAKGCLVLLNHEFYMNLAYQEALKAYDEKEIPVGAVIVHEGRIVGRGYNRTESLRDATAHAEIIAMSAASASLASWRLTGCTLYVTLEPCLMCLGAILQSRTDMIVYGTTDPRLGAVDTHDNREAVLNSYRRFPTVVSGILESECRAVLKSFFKELRKKN